MTLDSSWFRLGLASTMLLLWCSILINCTSVNQADRIKFIDDLEQFYTEKEARLILELVFELDNTILNIASVQNLESAYLKAFALFERPQTETDREEIAAKVGNLNLVTKSLIWQNGIQIFPTGVNRKGPYMMSPTLIIMKDSTFGRYIKSYLGQKDIRFKDQFLSYWESFEQPFTSAYSIIGENLDDLNLDLIQDRLFVAICIVTHVYNTPMTKELFEHFYKKDLPRAMADVQELRRSKNLPERNFRNELEKMNESRSQ